MPKNNKIGDRWLTAFAGPCVKDLIRMTSRIGEDPIVAAVVERTRVIRRWVVPVRFSIALILASTCDVECKHSHNKYCSNISIVLITKPNACYWNNDVSHLSVSLRK